MEIIFKRVVKRSRLYLWLSLAAVTLHTSGNLNFMFVLPAAQASSFTVQIPLPPLTSGDVMPNEYEKHISLPQGYCFSSAVSGQNEPWSYQETTDTTLSIHQITNPKSLYNDDKGFQTLFIDQKTEKKAIELFMDRWDRLLETTRLFVHLINTMSRYNTLQKETGISAEEQSAIDEMLALSTEENEGQNDLNVRGLSEEYGLTGDVDPRPQGFNAYFVVFPIIYCDGGDNGNSGNNENSEGSEGSEGSEDSSETTPTAAQYTENTIQPENPYHSQHSQEVNDSGSNPNDTNDIDINEIIEIIGRNSSDPDYPSDLLSEMHAGVSSDKDDVDPFIPTVLDGNEDEDKDKDEDEDEDDTRPLIPESVVNGYFYTPVIAAYNPNNKGPKPKELTLPEIKIPNNPSERITLVDPARNNKAHPNASYHGKQRHSEAGDTTPNPNKLLEYKRTIKKWENIRASLGNTNTPKDRKNKTNIAARICRLTKTANHEARKIIFNGVEEEKVLLAKKTDEIKAAISQYKNQNTRPEFTCLALYEHIIINNPVTPVAGTHKNRYMNSVLEDAEEEARGLKKAEEEARGLKEAEEEEEAGFAKKRKRM